jgi:hypothetical protein
MDEGLSVIGVAGKEVAFELLLVDPADLLSDGDRVPRFVVDAGDPEDDRGDVSALLPDDLFRLDLGLRIIPGRFDRRRLIDQFAGSRGLHDQQTAGEDELFDVEVLEMLQETAGSLNGEVVVQPAWLSLEVVVSGEVDDARDVVAVVFTEISEGGLDLVGLCEIDLNIVDLFAIVGRRWSIKAHHGVLPGQPLDNPTPDQTFRTGHEDKGLVAASGRERVELHGVSSVGSSAAERDETGRKQTAFLSWQCLRDSD